METFSVKVGRFFHLMVCLSAPLALAACVSTSNSLTAVTGLQPVNDQPATSADILASLDGGLVSRSTDLRLTQRDRLAALQSEYRALEYTAPSQPVYWQSQSGNVTGTVIPSQPYRVGSQDCRQYTHLVTAGGGTAEHAGTACRNTDGSWSLLT